MLDRRKNLNFSNFETFEALQALRARSEKATFF
jgi:hypothetical protein